MSCPVRARVVARTRRHSRGPWQLRRACTGGRPTHVPRRALAIRSTPCCHRPGFARRVIGRPSLPLRTTSGSATRGRSAPSLRARSSGPSRSTALRCVCDDRLVDLGVMTYAHLRRRPQEAVRLEGEEGGWSGPRSVAGELGLAKGRSSRAKGTSGHGQVVLAPRTSRHVIELSHGRARRA